MSKEYHQKTRSKTLNFSIEDTGVLVIQKTKYNEIELFYPFEDIRTNKTTLLHHNISFLLLACLLAAITICLAIAQFWDTEIEKSAVLIWIIGAIAAFIIYYSTRSRKLHLQTTQASSIQFYLMGKNKESIGNFVHTIIEDRNIYLNSKYGNISKNLDYSTQLDNLNWLLNLRALPKIEYDSKLLALNITFNANLNTRPIGFSNKNNLSN